MSEEQLPLPVFLTTWAFDPPKSQIKPADIIPSQRARRGSSLSHLPILLVTVTFGAGALGRVLPDPRSAQLLLRGPSSETLTRPWTSRTLSAATTRPNIRPHAICNHELHRLSYSLESYEDADSPSADLDHDVMGSANVEAVDEGTEVSQHTNFSLSCSPPMWTVFSGGIEGYSGHSGRHRGRCGSFLTLPGFALVSLWPGESRQPPSGTTPYHIPVHLPGNGVPPGVQ